MATSFYPETYARITGTFSRPADNTAYAQGDHIANSTTAGSVVPITFSLPGASGAISGCRCIVTPASGNLVIAGLDFDLLLFRPATSVPFAAGSYPADNAALAVSALAFRNLVAVFQFFEGAWRNPAGLLTAGVTGAQRSLMADAAMAPFNVGGLSTRALYGLVQAQDAWTPTGVVNQFDFILDMVS